jgi:hypothetical protein
VIRQKTKAEAISHPGLVHVQLAAAWIRVPFTAAGKGGYVGHGLPVPSLEKSLVLRYSDTLN